MSSFLFGGDEEIWPSAAASPCILTDWRPKFLQISVPANRFCLKTIPRIVFLTAKLSRVQISYNVNKKRTHQWWALSCLAEMKRFELLRRYSRPTAFRAKGSICRTAPLRPWKTQYFHLFCEKLKNIWIFARNLRDRCEKPIKTFVCSRAKKTQGELKWIKKN